MSFKISWLLVGTSLAFGPELAYRLRVAQPTLMEVTRYFWYTIILLYLFVCHIFMTSLLWLAVVLGLYKEVYLQIFKCVFFFITRLLWLVERFGTRNPFNHTRWMAVVTPKLPSKVGSQSLFLVFLVAFLCCQLVVEFSVGKGSGSDLVLFLLTWLQQRSLIILKFLDDSS